MTSSSFGNIPYFFCDCLDANVSDPFEIKEMHIMTMPIPMRTSRLELCKRPVSVWFAMAR